MSDWSFYNIINLMFEIVFFRVTNSYGKSANY